MDPVMGMRGALQAAPSGLHLIGDLHRCRGAASHMVDGCALRERCLALVSEAQLTVIGDHFHQFDGAGGVTGVVVLAESHLAVHTWPERRSVTLDVYVCNYSADNRDKARHLFDALLLTFSPEKPNIWTIERI